MLYLETLDVNFQFPIMYQCYHCYQGFIQTSKLTIGLLELLLGSLNIKTLRSQNTQSSSLLATQNKERIYDGVSWKSGSQFLQASVVSKFCGYFVLDVAKLSSAPQSEPNYSSPMSSSRLTGVCMGRYSSIPS